MGITMRGVNKMSGEKEEQVGEATAAAGRPAGAVEAEKSSNADSHSDLEAKGIQELGEVVRDALRLGSGWAHSVVPVSCLLRQGSALELNLRHHGLGPQGAQALASTLTSNLSIKRLDLRDNRLGVAGVEALADVLSQTSSICDVDLSENQLGAPGARALCAALAVNRVVQKMALAGNGLEEQAAKHLAEFLLIHTGVKSLDLSYNQLNDLSGETLGPALAENAGLTELNISWNHLRGPGAIAFARGLEANIFLKALDLSYNGFGDAGASAVGEALKANNVLEELNISNNRISVSGALSLGLGLQVNQTLRILVVSASLTCVSPHGPFKIMGLHPGAVVCCSAEGSWSTPPLTFIFSPVLPVASLEPTIHPGGLVGCCSDLPKALCAQEKVPSSKVSRNPMRSEGCFGLLKSVHDNPASALELLDFSDIQVNREFDDLASSAKEILPGLCVKTGARRVEYKKSC